MELPQSAHDPAEMRRLSNAGHWVEGGLLGVVGVLALLESLGIMTGGWVFLWPGLLVAAGLFLPLVIFSHSHASYESIGGRGAILKDPQQRQHLVMGELLLLAGLAELIAGVFGFGLLRYVLPLALAAIGVLFTVHTQHGTTDSALRAVRIHRVLGGTLILAGLARAAAVLTGLYQGTVGLGWIVLLLAAAGQLLIYREPEGAYADGQATG